MEDKILELCEKVLELKGDIEGLCYGDHCRGIICDKHGCPFYADNNKYNGDCGDMNDKQLTEIAKEYIATYGHTETPILSLQQALNEKYEGRMFKVKCPSGVELKVQLVDEDFEVISDSNNNKVVNHEALLVDYVTVKGLLDCKFELIEEGLTLDNFDYGEEFILVDDNEYTAKKLNIFNKDFIAIEFKDGHVTVLEVNSFLIKNAKFKRNKN